MALSRRRDERETIADIATMITKGAFKIGTSLTVITAKYILGMDVKVASRIFIGDNVDWKFICLTRLVFLGVMYNYRNVIHNPYSVNEKGRRRATGLVPKVKDWIDAWIAQARDSAESAQAMGEVGANLQMLTTSLLSVTNKVLFQLIGSAIQVVRTIARTGFKLVNAATGLFPGAARFNITTMHVALVEAFFTNNVIAQNFGAPAALGLGVFASLVSVATIVENKFIGITAASIEYVAYRGTPRITTETMDMLLDVSRSDQQFLTDFPFTSETAEVEKQLPESWSVIPFINFWSSPLFNAIRDARSIVEFRMARRPSLREPSLRDMAMAASLRLRARSGSRSVDELTGRFNTLTIPDAGESKTEQRAQESKTGGGAVAPLPITGPVRRRRNKTPDTCRDGQCRARTKRGKQCKLKGKYDGLCKRHAGGAYLGKKDNMLRRTPLRF